MEKKFFDVPRSNSLPKFEQIVHGVTEAIARKELRRGSTLPSISQVSDQVSFSRETVAKAYRKLKHLGIIKTTPGKGNYVASESITHTVKVLLLLNAFNPDNRVLYNAFIEEIASNAVIDTYFHHYNIDVLRTLLLDNKGKYGWYVVKPFHHQGIPEIMQKMDPGKVLILDRRDHLNEDYPFVCQNFDESVYQCLEAGVELIRKYKQLNFVCPESALHPVETIQAFERFCRKYDIKYNFIEGFAERKAQDREAYLTVFDDDMIDLLELCKTQRLQVGRDVGIISYNDIPMKKFIAGGITVISTDFKRMGVVAAQYVLDRKLREQIIPTSLIVRNSL